MSASCSIVAISFTASSVTSTSRSLRSRRLPKTIGIIGVFSAVMALSPTLAVVTTRLASSLTPSRNACRFLVSTDVNSIFVPFKSWVIVMIELLMMLSVLC